MTEAVGKVWLLGGDSSYTAVADSTDVDSLPVNIPFGIGDGIALYVKCEGGVNPFTATNWVFADDTTDTVAVANAVAISPSLVNAVNLAAATWYVYAFSPPACRRFAFRFRQTSGGPVNVKAFIAFGG